MTPRAQRLYDMMERICGAKLDGVKKMEMLEYIEESSRQFDFERVPDCVLEAVFRDMFIAIKAQRN